MPELRFYAKRVEGKLFLDSIESTNAAKAEAEEGFEQWVTKDDIEIYFDISAMKELQQESDAYWKKRYEAVGLNFPLS